MTAGRTDEEDEAIEEFLREYFRTEYQHDPSTLSNEEKETIEALVNRAEDYFASSKGTLGLAIDFLMVAEQLSQVDDWLNGFDSSLTADDVRSRYDERDTDTLTFLLDGNKYGIRPVQNDVITVFRDALNRTNFPSSPGHHTGKWDEYEDMFELANQLSRTGRYEAAQRLFDVGLDRLDSQSLPTREPPFSSPFYDILQDYQRSHPDENGGAAYQAFAYGYVKAKWTHLSLTASKVRTGSSRQNRYGDIDGYVGPDLMLSVEAKDRDITMGNVRGELGEMMKLAEDTTAMVIALCRSVSDNATDVLEDAGVTVITDEDLEQEIASWDYHQQDRAVQGMVHYFYHIEENPKAVQRILRFIEQVDPENTALAHLES
ncbi:MULTISPECIES: hypothetical protein [Halobacterium]|uniref:hypothetical protein n=1 Tax=Halobacterium TaxID=2239 RepID=UPI00073EAD54|nr:MULTISPECIES: hypothetical protein [Halobacterium]MCG1002453.1 hypothetical protein [Halobacterium noricense]